MIANNAAIQIKLNVLKGEEEDKKALELMQREQREEMSHCFFFFLFKHKNSCSLCQQVGFKTSLLSLLLLCLKKQNNSPNINPEFLQSIAPDTLDNCKYIPNFLRPFPPRAYFFPNKMAKRKREHKDYAIK